MGILDLFIEIEPSSKKPAVEKPIITTLPAQPTPSNQHLPLNSSSPSIQPSGTLTTAELEKFEKHFTKLFQEANMPGPDYYEFVKTDDTLKAHIIDEKARFGAAFATLSIQGLTKTKLLEAAEYYKQVIQKDKLNFESEVDDKSKTELDSRKNEVSLLETKIQSDSDQIRKLTEGIQASQQRVDILKNEISTEEQRIFNNKQGYLTASTAMLNKIDSDIQKININL